MNKAGHSIDTLLLCGGLTKNELFIQTHADVTGKTILFTGKEMMTCVPARRHIFLQLSFSLSERETKRSCQRAK